MGKDDIRKGGRRGVEGWRVNSAKVENRHGPRQIAMPARSGAAEGATRGVRVLAIKPRVARTGGAARPISESKLLRRARAARHRVGSARCNRATDGSGRRDNTPRTPSTVASGAPH